jgi:gluconate 5-dehydrogenase
MEAHMAASNHSDVANVASLRQLFDLLGQVALITGGSRGLGLQIAEALGELGAIPVLVARKEAELSEAMSHLASLSITADAVPADLGAIGAIDGLVQTVLARHGHVDFLVNNAGATWGAPAEIYPLEA